MTKKIFLQILSKYTSKWLILLIDTILVLLSFVLAYLVRFNLSLNFNITSLYKELFLIIIVSLFSFLIVGSYKGIIRHTGIKDAFNVFLATSLQSFIIIVIVLINNLFNFFESFTIPISIVLVHYLISNFVLVLSRFVFKAFYEIISTELKSATKILIYGAGDSGLITYGALNRDTKNNYDIFGFLDDDRNKINKKIDRIKIFDPSKFTKEFIQKNGITEVIISIQNIKPNRLLEITGRLLKLNIKPKIVPPLSKWIGGNLQTNQIKKVNIDDLLGREKIDINNPIVKKEVTGKKILVTGAAGSIGSEISRQLAIYQLQSLILIDQAESPLYDLQQELYQSGNKNFLVIIGDVRDKKRMEEVFLEHLPDKVFHAAAYKHVPLMELSPYEAIKVNIYGTKNIADLSLKYNVDRFVMISTDKAVNPTNVMGATKRAAEMYISCLSEQENNKTKFTITRFGNVLGSNGSVIPLFKNQIKKGGPLTLTHKDITRYFMTIPEACSLVLEAGTMGEGGEIYIFDMGKSVKIFDLAKRMISLSGLEYPNDIDIKITGLRPGEKLYEELLANGENTLKTYHEKIMIAKTNFIDIKMIKENIENLYLNREKLTNNDIVLELKKIIPEYISKNSIYQKLDVKHKN